MAISAALFTGCNDKDDDLDKNPTEPGGTGKLVLKLDHGWGPAHDLFSLNTPLVHPLTQEEITFTTLRYYVSNIELHRADGSVWKEEESYRIATVTATNSEPHLEIDDIPAGRYNQITFTIGVDSVRNVSGAQTGALSPSEGMFWSWTTGYIFIMAEGNSPASPSGSFVYHIGGFAGANNAIRSKTMDFQGASLDIAPNAVPSIHINVNAARFWHGGISLNDIRMIHMPGANAVTLADNFIGAFRFDHLHR